MKKSILIALICLVLKGYSQQDGAWSFGLQWGFQGNTSEFSGGMETANARFQHNSYGSGALDFLARFDYNNHWMLTGGIGFSSFGFDYALTKNYSLLTGNEENRYCKIRSSFSMVTLPVMVYYKFNPNCKNSKWVIGAGFAQLFTDDAKISASYVDSPEANANANYIASASDSRNDFYTMWRFSVGREKVFKSGSILNASMLFNFGTKTMATSTVSYEVDGESYSHQFTNRGNFIGFRLSYFFKPFYAPKQLK
ncbi:MAG: hypothetical protein PSX36_06165 [bacterium]|nr:hypothetical protein [bacterium]